MEEHLFSRGPQVQLDFYLQDGLIHRITLKHASRFCCKIHHPSSAACQAISDWLTLYIEGHPLEAPWAFLHSSFSSFQLAVTKTLEKIPFGTTQSYGEVAREAGYLRAARAVGNVCRDNPFPLLIPCHRVIHQNGGIGGFAFDILLKEKLLDFESQLNLSRKTASTLHP